MLPISLAVLTILLAIGTVYSIASHEPESRLHWLLRASTGGMFCFVVYQVGAWVLISYYLRFLFLGIFLVAISISFLDVRPLPWKRKGRQHQHPVRFTLELLAFVIGMGLTALTVQSWVHPSRGVNLEFPLTDGAFVVMHGGNSPLTNPLNRGNYSRKFGMNMVQQNKFGNRAGGLAPLALDAYVIYAAEILSPCDGEVVELHDGVAENRPGRPDTAGELGNRMVIRSGNVNIVLGHLLPGSMEVAVGDNVTVGQPLAKVGNSGASVEPHLHISAHAAEAYDAFMIGQAVPIFFKGRFLTANSMVWVGREERRRFN